MKRNGILSCAAALLCAGIAGTSQAQVDIDLIILEAKVDALGITLEQAAARIEIVDEQFEVLFERREEGLIALGDARARDLERILLGCALDPADCIPPMYIISNLEAECMEFDEEEPPPGEEHEHDLGFLCPLREVIEVVAHDIEVAEAQGLDRDFPMAKLALMTAIDAAVAGDGRTAFLRACAAFKELACP